MSCTFLVPLDGSLFAERALPTAVSLVKEQHGRLELVFVQESTPRGRYNATRSAAQRSWQVSYLADKAREVSDEFANDVGHTLVTGEVADAICARAREVDAKMIVMTTHGRTGMNRAWNGSVADAIVRRSPLPVLLLRQPTDRAVRRSPPRAFRRIVIALDGSPDAAAILDAASAVATRGCSELHLVWIVAPVTEIVDISFPFGYLTEPADDPATKARVASARRTADGLALMLKNKSGCDVIPHVLVGRDAADKILTFAWAYGADLIALTTGDRGKSTPRLFTGRVVDKLLRGSSIPLLVSHSSAREPVAVRAQDDTGVQPVS